MGNTLTDTRSTSAAGFTMSPSSPLNSSFLNSVPVRQLSQPGPSGGSVFDQLNSANGPQLAQAIAAQQQTLASSPTFNTVLLEMQRLRDDNTIARSTLVSYEEKFQHLFQVRVI